MKKPILLLSSLLTILSAQELVKIEYNYHSGPVSPDGQIDTVRTFTPDEVFHKLTIHDYADTVIASDFYMYSKGTFKSIAALSSYPEITALDDFYEGMLVGGYGQSYQFTYDDGTVKKISDWGGGALPDPLLNVKQHLDSILASEPAPRESHTIQVKDEFDTVFTFVPLSDDSINAGYIYLSNGNTMKLKSTYIPPLIEYPYLSYELISDDASQVFAMNYFKWNDTLNNDFSLQNYEDYPLCHSLYDIKTMVYAPGTEIPHYGTFVVGAENTRAPHAVVFNSGKVNADTITYQVQKVFASYTNATDGWCGRAANDDDIVSSFANDSRCGGASPYANRVDSIRIRFSNTKSQPVTVQEPVIRKQLAVPTMSEGKLTFSPDAYISEVSISAVNGRVLFTKAEPQITELTIPNLSAGIYLVNMSSLAGASSFRIIME